MASKKAPFFDRFLTEKSTYLFQKCPKNVQKHVLGPPEQFLEHLVPPVARAATGGKEEGLKRKGCFSSSPPSLLLLIGREGGRPAVGRARNNTPFFTPGKKHTQNAHLQKRPTTFVVYLFL